MAQSLLMVGGPLNGQHHNGDVQDVARVAYPAPADSRRSVAVATYRRRDIHLPTGNPYALLVSADITLFDALCMLEARYASSTRQIQNLQAELDELRAYREQIEGMAEICLNRPKRRATQNTQKSSPK